MSPNKKTVQRYMDAYGRWDHAEVLACLTEDVEWVVPGAFHLVGREAFDNEIEGHGAAGPPEIVVSPLIEEDDIVMAEGIVRNALEDGGVLSLAFCDVFLMRDSKIRQVTSYLMAVPDSAPGRLARYTAESSECLGGRGSFQDRPETVSGSALVTVEASARTQG